MEWRVVYCLLIVMFGCSTPGARPAAGVPAGAQSNPADSARVAVVSLASSVFGNTRALRVYLPPGYHDGRYSQRRYPVLYMNDGFALFRASRAAAIADSLIRAGELPPLIIVGIDNAASIPGVENPGAARANEYLPYPDRTEPDLPAPQGARYPGFLFGEVIPLIEARFRVSRDPRERGLGGSSYGAIAALYTMIQQPGEFGMLLLESPPLFLFDGRLLRESASLRDHSAIVYLGVGTAETPDATSSAAGDSAIAHLA